MKTCRVFLLPFLICLVSREKAFHAVCQLSKNLSLQLAGNFILLFFAADHIMFIMVMTRVETNKIHNVHSCYST